MLLKNKTAKRTTFQNLKLDDRGGENSCKISLF